MSEVDENGVKWQEQVAFRMLLDADDVVTTEWASLEGICF